MKVWIRPQVNRPQVLHQRKTRLSKQQKTSVTIVAPVGSTAADKKAKEGKYDVVLYFPADKYPETTTHIVSTIEKGQSAILYD